MYECKECGIAFELVLKMANRLDPTNCACPECGFGRIEQMLSAPMSIDIHKLMQAKKPDGEFRERMQKIHQNTPGSTLNQGNYF